MTLSLRISDELHARLKALAEREKRSLNNMMEVLLERGVSAAEVGESSGEPSA